MAESSVINGEWLIILGCTNHTILDPIRLLTSNWFLTQSGKKHSGQYCDDRIGLQLLDNE